jgi:prepilin-type N-terminal cleavage/methylation domain-containing protein
MIKAKKQFKSGFTLLEMIVSMGIFTIVAVIAVGSLVRITSLNRQAQSMQAAINNINYILESMSREMRVGSAYHCMNGNVFNGNSDTLTFRECPGEAASEKGILFRSSKTDATGCGLLYAYWFKKDGDFWSLSKSQQSACNQSLKISESYPLVDTGNVKIEQVEFSTFRGALNHARFSIRLQGYSGAKENERNFFDVRTLVSQRIAD